MATKFDALRIGPDAILSEPDLAKQLAGRGAYVKPMSPSEFNEFVNAQQAQWRPGAASVRDQRQIDG